MKSGRWGVPSPSEFLAKELPTGSIVGIDPLLHSVQDVQKYKEKFNKHNIHIKYLSYNPIDMIWPENERPKLPSSAIRQHDITYAGQSVSEKLQTIRNIMKKKDCHGYVISSLDEIAWVFNLRGSDVSCNPVFISYGLITHSKDLSML